MMGINEIECRQLSSLGGQVESGELVLVDVRTPAEMAQGMLPGAIAMPMHLVPLKLDEIRGHRQVVFYCRTGARSGQVCAFLQQQGIDCGVNLRGGIVQWHRQGYLLEFPQARTAHG